MPFFVVLPLRDGDGGLTFLDATFRNPPPYNQFTRSDFKEPIGSEIGRRRSDGPISRIRFCGENVGRSFVVTRFSELTKNL